MLTPLGNRKLEYYQSNGIKKAYQKLKTVKSLVIVSPTGSGKTVVACNISADFINAQEAKGQNRKILILVHREEILNQMRLAHFEWFGIIPEFIDAGTRFLPDAKVYIAMVETLNNRVDDVAFMNQIGEIGLLMVDECHLSNFFKVFNKFDVVRIGFTATPISANKKMPLNEQWEDIVILSTVPELIEINKVNQGRGVIHCSDYSFSIVDRSKIKTKGDDFDDDANGKEFSRLEQIGNTIDAINKVAYNKKLVIFNANVDHSKRMNKALLEAGFNSRHIDSTKDTSKQYRNDTLGKWIENTTGGIINNVGIATIGTDIRCLEGGVFNYCTKSFTKYKQCLGRPARPFQYENGSFMEYFTWIDTGGNIQVDGNWRFDDFVDWETIFRFPKKKIKAGSPTVKTCPNCGAFNYPTAKICAGKRENWLTKKIVDCGYVFIFEEKEEDVIERKLVKIGSSIDVVSTIAFFKDRKEFYSYNQLPVQIANKIRSETDNDYLDEVELKVALELCYRKCTEWFKLKDRKKYRDFRKDTDNKILNELQKVGFKIEIEEYAESNTEY